MIKQDEQTQDTEILTSALISVILITLNCVEIS